MPPRINDLGLGELPVDSAQDRALAGLLCAGNGVKPKPGESDRWRDGSALGQDAGGIVRGSSRWMGACSVISGVIVSPAGISGPAPGALIHSRSLVLVLVLVVVVLVLVVDATIWCDDMHHRYALPICTTDMVRRYGEPICKAGKQKRPRACCSWPLMVYFCDSLLLFSYPFKYFSHISGNNTGEELLQLN